MTALLILAALVSYQAPPRVPDALLQSDLSDRNVRVWLAVRKVQGANDSAWARAEHYAAVAGKTLGATKNALAQLTADGWLEEIGKRGRTPERRCVVPASAAGDSSRSVTNNVTHRDESGARNVTDGDPYSSRSVTNNVTHRDHSPIEAESGQGIRSGNPIPEQQQQQGSAKTAGENAEPGSRAEQSGGGERFPFDERLARRLIGRGVHAATAAEVVTVVRPGRVLMELDRVARIEALGPVDKPGGLLVRYLRDPERPLPGFDERAALSDFLAR